MHWIKCLAAFVTQEEKASKYISMSARNAMYRCVSGPAEQEARARREEKKIVHSPAPDADAHQVH